MKEKLDTKKARTGSSVVNATTSEWLYHVKITNRASQLIEGLQMRFQIHYTDVEGKTKNTEFKSGAKVVPALKPGESTIVDTDTVELMTTKLEGGWVYTNGARPRQSDTLKGIAVTLEHNGKNVHEYTEGGVKKVIESADKASAKR